MDINNNLLKKIGRRYNVKNFLIGNRRNKISESNYNLTNIYSEWGQDFIFLSIFNRLNMNYKDITYLDLGAFKPDISNNTFSLYIRGSRGVLVEANPTLINDLKTKRSKDIILNNCIVPFKSNYSQIDFYVLEPPELSSISKKIVDTHINTGMATIKEIKTIYTITPKEIIEKFFNDKSPDLISIDIEGIEDQIIERFDFNKYRPKLFCIESWINKQGIAKHMHANNYTLLASVVADDIYIDNKLGIL